MPGDTSENAGILVLHFSLDDAMAEAAIVSAGGNLAPDLFGRIESCIDHAQRSKNLVLAEAIERLIREPFQRDA